MVLPANDSRALTIESVVNMLLLLQNTKPSVTNAFV